MDEKRLIEVDFPLQQTSLDSVHEKYVRHGHISTLHIWPARRPLAACRAALLATLLPDPGDEEERQRLLKDIGGEVVTATTRSSKEKQTTKGGVLHWKRENSPKMDEFRKKIREAFDGRAPKVLDPFAGGGAIPLEAMRLGCDVTAIDINPVAWFILKCTLEYPQQVAGEERPLPDFALENPAFMDTYLKKQTDLTRTQVNNRLEEIKEGRAEPLQEEMFGGPPKADLSWHVRAWGHWVLDRAREELAEFYPTYAHFETAEKEPTRHNDELKLVPTNKDGTPDIDALNAGFDEEYLADETTPRWVAKPTVAYLWARTVECKGCRATLPLLKTQWLCRKPGKRIRLTMDVKKDNSGVEFGIERDVSKGVDPDKTSGTMSRSGATCPCCDTTMTKEDIRQEGQSGRISEVMTAVVIDGQNDKEYRLPSDEEQDAANLAAELLPELFDEIPFGLPNEPTPTGGKGASRAFSVRRYGMDEWGKLFSSRQLFALGVFVKRTREVRDVLLERGYPSSWSNGIQAYLACVLNRLSNRCSSIGMWHVQGEKVEGVYGRFALSMKWDFPEVVPTSDLTGGYPGAVEWVARATSHVLKAGKGTSTIVQQSALDDYPEQVDAIVTDPPYYDAIPYSDTMDFFHVWLRRVLSGRSDECDEVFSSPLAPKWDPDENDGELIDDPSRFDGDADLSKQNYEDGMAAAFEQCHKALTDNGRLCIVFANKSPDAWETLVNAVIRAGFVVDASWPIETELSGGLRTYGRASLSSSIWIVCRKRSPRARPGWDGAVLDEMRENITEKLRRFWDAGIRGPDFVWAATGPALEAYSKHPIVKKADAAGERMKVDEFLEHVRREVIEFAVGEVLPGDEAEVGETLDAPTAYYLLHRHDFGLEKTGSSACILYAISCGLKDSDLAGKLDILAKKRSDYRLKAWDERSKPQDEGTAGANIIDHIHRLMVLWDAGDRDAVDDYIDRAAITEHPLFDKVLQAILELADNDERRILESLSNRLSGYRRQNGGKTPETTDMFE